MVLLAVITATSMRMVAPGGPLIVVALSPADHLVVTLHLTSIAEVVEQQGDPVGYRCPSGLETNRGLPIMPRRCRGKFRGATTLSRGRTFDLLHRYGLEEIAELAADPSPLRGRGLGHCSD